MYPFWSMIVRPLLLTVEPRKLVEVGAEAGKNTANLLAYCEEKDATLQAVDPAPKFDVKAWEARHAGRLSVHRDLSVNVLPKLPPYDCVFLDGDHNWYTVYTELQLIDQRSTQRNEPFPLTFLHDIGWPYARRDLYYAPETIPQPYRLPYRRKGITPGVSALAEKGGFNAGLNNAEREGGPRNGVLTAIEDFVRESSRPLELVTIPGFAGLGILFEKPLKERNAAFAQVLAGVTPSPALRQLMEQVEMSRMRLMVR